MNTRPAATKITWLVGAAVFVVVAIVTALVIGPTSIDRTGTLLELFDAVTPGDIDSGLNERQISIVRNLRLPRIALGLLVGAALATAGATYQGVFQNPLADPYLLGVAAGGGLGATIAFIYDLGDGRGFLDMVQILAFIGALSSVALTWTIGVLGDRTRASTSLILAGVAVASFFTAIQTFLQQQDTDDLRQVYTWFLGGLNTSGWTEVLQLFPVAAICLTLLALAGRTLDILSVGDDEASMLGLSVGRTRIVLVVVASLLTAAAVAVSGLIAFVGLIVPHTVRLLFGSSYRVIVPMSIAVGAGFLVLSDLVARTALTPAELPIGVVTAFFGAPFFVVILRTASRT
ncbi:MAG: iron ABC transporter permease [Acidimicrobiia bacterium]|nr:iron ABC transporter permease [Acidimicrobiia bacterium]